MSAKAPKPGMILSPEVLAKMMAEDDDELLNDPEFLLFLQNQGRYRLFAYITLNWHCNLKTVLFKWKMCWPAD